MRNLLVALGSKALVLVAIAVHWLLDDIVVDMASKVVFGLTGNGYRFEEFLVFWNKKKPEAEK
jgi:hypothetical protein